MDDDLMPNDATEFLGGVPRQPIEQEVASRKEKAQTLQALPVIKEVIEHLNKRISDRDSIESVRVDLTEDPALFQKVMETNKLVKQALQEEKDYLEGLLESHAKNL